MIMEFAKITVLPLKMYNQQNKCTVLLFSISEDGIDLSLFGTEDNTVQLCWFLFTRKLRDCELVLVSFDLEQDWLVR
ncbi:hypothetical protein T01_8120 [Trichinella spiralis]|uniref:Uncharacterized protein n=1 Tax=Trichinella spiralis TaxID=6334 RepID=A0A0V1BYL4_TRISP|nr:hypothetical protein T01_8120 [Trichinella spiralis]